MKVAILAGGTGSHLSEEPDSRPKPMVEIGGYPILWHIMRHFEHYGFREFVIALGYKGEYVKKYFVDYCALEGDITIDFETGGVVGQSVQKPSWRMNLVETGISTATGGRIRRLQPFVDDQTFLLAWGDSVSDIDIRGLVDFHRSHGKLATMTVVHPVARFGHLQLDGDAVTEFSEKPQTVAGWINGAVFALEPGVFGYIEGDETWWEKGPLERLAADGQLCAYKHTSFWQCMDTLRDRKYLEDLWDGGDAPWKIWE